MVSGVSSFGVGFCFLSMRRKYTAISSISPIMTLAAIVLRVNDVLFLNAHPMCFQCPEKPFAANGFSGPRPECAVAPAAASVWRERFGMVVRQGFGQRVGLVRGLAEAEAVCLEVVAVGDDFRDTSFDEDIGALVHHVVRPSRYSQYGDIHVEGRPGRDHR